MPRISSMTQIFRKNTLWLSGEFTTPLYLSNVTRCIPPPLPESVEPQVLLLAMGHDDDGHRKYWGVIWWLGHYYVTWRRFSGDWAYQAVVEVVAKKRWREKRTYYIPLLNTGKDSSLFSAAEAELLLASMTDGLYRRGTGFN